MGEEQQFIRLRGVRHNNLKNFDLDLPTGKLIVVTGLSGSGKSSLAFDTLYAEGQRRYIETFSPYARQFFDRMDKPRVDRIEGIPPAIALEQRNAVKTTRSTVGTMTEITDYMKLLWPHIAKLHCRGCGKVVRKDSAGEIWRGLRESRMGQEVVVTFELPLSEKLSVQESLGLISKQGYQRLLLEVEGERKAVRLEEALPLLEGAKPGCLCVVQDRIRVEDRARARFTEACEHAFHFGKGSLVVYLLPEWERGRYSNRLHCAECDIEYRDPSPALFSFNNPVGACPVCKGFGRTIAIDYQLTIPDRSLSLAGGAVKPWQTGTGLQSQHDLLKTCRKRGVPTDVPFEEMSKEHQQLVIEGDPGYGADEAAQWPRAWYGVKGYFRWLETKAYKMHVRVQLAKYRCYITCPQCKGDRFKPEALLYRISGNEGGMTLADFYRSPVQKALGIVEGLQKPGAKKNDPFFLAVEEVRSRLAYLEEVGLGYLTLDRATRTLSGGETERVNLTTCLGSRLVNTLFVLDEPSVGLHPRDTERLVTILERLRDTGNTIVVVEHEAGVMRAADEIIDIGPGQGEKGGRVVFQGTLPKLLKSSGSLTGQYLSGKKRMELRGPRPVDLKGGPKLNVTQATLHNLTELAVEIPLGRLVVVTGVSGSGKSTLVRELIFPVLSARLMAEESSKGEEETEEDEGGSSDGSCRIAGSEALGKVLMVDQTSIGRTPRSTPAVYLGAMEEIRSLFGNSKEAEAVAMDESHFSFNSKLGQCEKCRGAGFEKIEMQFLSDVFIRCPDCQGRRYREGVLQVKIGPEQARWNVADLLDATVEDAIDWLGNFEGRAAKNASKKLILLQKLGLGYLKLGQPVNTLSGGESQRLKLASHLAQFDTEASSKPTLFIFDEPTTGLHFEDVRVLLIAFQELVDAGHSLMVVEHNLEVVRAADWVIDLGPEAGEHGGKLVAQGTPEEIAKSRASHTGAALRGELARNGNGR